MKQVMLAVGLAFVVVGSGHFQSHLKAWPQVVFLVVAALPLLGVLIRQERAFLRAWSLLFGIALLEATMELGEQCRHLLGGNQGQVIINGERHVVMTYGWVWPIAIAFATTPLIVLAYARLSGRPKQVEVGFASAILITWAILFVRNEL